MVAATIALKVKARLGYKNFIPVRGYAPYEIAGYILQHFSSILTT